MSTVWPEGFYNRQRFHANALRKFTIPTGVEDGPSPEIVTITTGTRLTETPVVNGDTTPESSGIVAPAAAPTSRAVTTYIRYPRRR